MRCDRYWNKIIWQAFLYRTIISSRCATTFLIILIILILFIILMVYLHTLLVGYVEDPGRRKLLVHNFTP